MGNFSGRRVLSGCLLFIFVVMSGSGLYSAGYSQLAPTFSISVTFLGTCSMVLTVSGIVSGILLTSVKRRITLKGVLYYDAAVFYAVALGAWLLQNRLATLLLFLFSIGTTLSMGAHAVMTEIVSNWYIQRRARYLSLILGCALLGQAAYQFIGGQVFSRMPFLQGLILLYAINGTLLLLSAKFLVIAVSPQEIGQIPLGGATPAAPPQASDAKPTQHTCLYRMPVFWLCLIGDWCLSGGVNYITTYATSFFTDNGISLETSTMILSCATISATFFSFLNGRIMEKLGVKGYVAFLLAGVVLGNLSMILYGAYPWIPLVLCIVIFYGIGYSGAHCINIISGLIFPPEDTANANSKISSIAMSGGLLLLPLCGYLAEHVGYSAVYLVVMFFAIVSLVCFELALSLAKNGN